MLGKEGKDCFAHLAIYLFKYNVLKRRLCLFLGLHLIVAWVYTSKEIY